MPGHQATLLEAIEASNVLDMQMALPLVGRRTADLASVRCFASLGPGGAHLVPPSSPQSFVSLVLILLIHLVLSFSSFSDFSAFSSLSSLSSFSFSSFSSLSSLSSLVPLCLLASLSLPSRPSPRQQNTHTGLPSNSTVLAFSGRPPGCLQGLADAARDGCWHAGRRHHEGQRGRRRDADRPGCGRVHTPLLAILNPEPTPPSFPMVATRLPNAERGPLPLLFLFLAVGNGPDQRTCQKRPSIRPSLLLLSPLPLPLLFAQKLLLNHGSRVAERPRAGADVLHRDQTGRSLVLIAARNLNAQMVALLVHRAALAVGETVILLHPPLPLAGVSIGTERGRQQNDSLANG